MIADMAHEDAALGCSTDIRGERGGQTKRLLRGVGRCRRDRRSNCRLVEFIIEPPRTEFRGVVRGVNREWGSGSVAIEVPGNRTKEATGGEAVAKLLEEAQ